MNGVEHYRKAEEWAGIAAGWFRRDCDDAIASAQAAAQIAQVHATLAQAAATAMMPSGTDNVTVSGKDEWVAWRDAVGVKDGEDGEGRG